MLDDNIWLIVVLNEIVVVLFTDWILGDCDLNSKNCYPLNGLIFGQYWHDMKEPFTCIYKLDFGGLWPCMKELLLF